MLEKLVLSMPIRQKSSC